MAYDSSRRQDPMSWLAIVLIGACLTDQVMSEQFFPLKALTDEFPPEKLVDKLNEHWWAKAGDPSPIVAGYLARTSDKNRSKAILNEFSVNELLAMNDFQLNKCTAANMEAGREDCDKLKGNQYLNKYCRALSRQLIVWCDRRRDEVAEYTLTDNGFSEAMKTDLLAFQDEVNKKIAYVCRREFQPSLELLSETISEILEEPRGEDLKGACEALVNELSGVEQIRKDGSRINCKRGSWTTIYKLCGVACDLTAKDIVE